MQKVALQSTTPHSNCLDLRERSQALKETSIRLRKASARLRGERSQEMLGPETEAFYDALRMLNIGDPGGGSIPFPFAPKVPKPR